MIQLTKNGLFHTSQLRFYFDDARTEMIQNRVQRDQAVQSDLLNFAFRKKEPVFSLVPVNLKKDVFVK